MEERDGTDASEADDLPNFAQGQGRRDAFAGGPPAWRSARTGWAAARSLRPRMPAHRCRPPRRWAEIRGADPIATRTRTLKIESRAALALAATGPRIAEWLDRLQFAL